MNGVEIVALLVVATVGPFLIWHWWTAHIRPHLLERTGKGSGVLRVDPRQAVPPDTRGDSPVPGGVPSLAGRRMLAENRAAQLEVRRLPAWQPGPRRPAA